MPARYRAVVIGCGRMGSTFADEARVPGVHSHAQAYSAHPRMELVGLVDTDPQRLNQAQRRWGVEADRDAVALCRLLRPDVVSVCTPDETHGMMAQQLFQEVPPRVLFIEKPLALHVEEGARVLELAEQRGCAIAVNYSRRFSPAFRALKEELERGVHGKPLLARFLYTRGLLHNGGHAIDLARWWFGEPVRMTAEPAPRETEDDDYAADVWFENGCHVRLEPFEERVATLFELDCLTERSRWRCWLGGERWEFAEVRDSPLYAGYKTFVPTERAQTDVRFAQPLGDCLRSAVDNLVGFLDGSEPLRCTGEDGLATLRIVERLRTLDAHLSTRR